MNQLTSGLENEGRVVAKTWLPKAADAKLFKAIQSHPVLQVLLLKMNGSAKKERLGH
jgi:hypothetical protein